jgi:hypothetical protein
VGRDDVTWDETMQLELRSDPEPRTGEGESVVEAGVDAETSVVDVVGAARVGGTGVGWDSTPASGPLAARRGAVSAKS